MFQKRYSRGTSSSSRRNFSRPNGGRNSGPSRGGQRGFRGSFISIDKYINKAAPVTDVPVEAYVPETPFADLKINSRLKTIIAQRGYKLPTAIQDKTIPHILEGKDLIGLANTGTGKTAAFLIPMINKMLTNRDEKLLVVVPTRELATQIQEEYISLTRGLNLFSVVIIGGANMHRQVSQLRSRPNLVVGTPGRLKDLVQQRKLDLSRFSNVVLDEADQMLDMGFINDIKFLLSFLTAKKQTLFFSATLPPAIEHLIKDFLVDPIRISIRSHATPAQIDQDVVRVKQGEDKIEVLHNLLKEAAFQKVLIFARTKSSTEKLSKILFSKGFRAESIHGNKSHGKRQLALKMFKEDRVEILVATDIAARGLDIPNVSHVINFDVPATYEDYIHRIGRTGRADKTGIALTFVS
jgi:superfamily II DNA/RNA helicase